MSTNWTSPPPLQTVHPLAHPLANPATHCLAYDQHGVLCHRSRTHDGHHANAEVGHVWEDEPPSPTGEDWGKTETRVVDTETGGEKGKKPQEYALIPVQALASIAEVYGYGATKYAPDNWRKGYAWSLSYSALQRHLNAFWGGEETDPESGLPHLAHAGFHILSLLTFASGEQYAGKDDRA